MFALSIVDYIHELKESGFTERQSEIQARRLVQLVTEAKEDVEQKISKEIQANTLVRHIDLDLAKKEVELSIETVRKDLELSIEKLRKDLELSIEKLRRDLELSIEKMRYSSLKFTVWTGVGVVMALGGMLAKGFHWF